MAERARLSSFYQQLVQTANDKTDAAMQVYKEALDNIQAAVKVVSSSDIVTRLRDIVRGEGKAMEKRLARTYGEDGVIVVCNLYAIR